MTDTVDMISPMLREMRAEIVALHDQNSIRFDRIEHRLTKIDEEMTSLCSRYGESSAGRRRACSTETRP